MSLRIAVTGREGQVARSIAELGPNMGATIVSLARPDVDLTRPETVRAALKAAGAQIVVSAAAYTAVDKAEDEEEVAYAVNALGAGSVAAAAAELKLPVIHLSTDYVFDGAKTTPYVETDPTRPMGAYGRTKLAGELAVAAATSNHVILRTAWVYSPFGANFVKTMLRLALQRPSISIVSDQYGNPSSALDLAEAILRVAQSVATDANPGLRGIFHMAGSGATTWAGLAEATFEYSRSLGGPAADVVRISTAEYPTAATRPASSRLNCTKLASLYSIELPMWRPSLVRVVARVLASG